ncbi:polymorphic toxin-type HINT domain-containing protein [Kitasatospora phosalacinea]|uniref:polymorphic toxin-type HINT domain-containing protein n=1 Tax=Kitasatospora phosalacinea TaxID=2065 RepID=UPI00366374E3
MADGSTRAIEEVRDGDTVTATDPQTGETGPKQVTTTITTPDDKEFTDLVLAPDADHPNRPSLLTSTTHHPYWSETRRQWVDAGDLTPGEHLRGPDGTLLTVGSVRSYLDGVVTHNLTVDQVHTYYVLVGTAPVLVHNCPTAEEPPYPKFSLYERIVKKQGPEPNATIADLDKRNIRDVNKGSESSRKQTQATRRARNPKRLLNSVFAPRNGVYMSVSRDGVWFDEGNHRAWKLIELAKAGKLPWDTPVYVWRIDTTPVPRKIY